MGSNLTIDLCEVCHVSMYLIARIYNKIFNEIH